MFSTTLIRDSLRDSGKHPHLVNEISGTHILLEPDGFSTEPVNTYEVLIEDRDNHHRVSIVAPDSAIRLMDEIRRGYQQNPRPVTYAETLLHSKDWTVDFNLEDDFRIEVKHFSLVTQSNEKVSAMVTEAALILSDICLNYLKI